MEHAHDPELLPDAPGGGGASAHGDAGAPGDAGGSRSDGADAVSRTAPGSAPGSAPAAGPAPGRKPFLLRLPPDLHDELRAWAEHDLRSLNGQIEYLLRDAVRRRRGGGRAGGGGTGA